MVEKCYREFQATDDSQQGEGKFSTKDKVSSLWFQKTITQHTSLMDIDGITWNIRIQTTLLRTSFGTKD